MSEEKTIQKNSLTFQELTELIKKSKKVFLPAGNISAWIEVNISDLLDKIKWEYDYNNSFVYSRPIRYHVETKTLYL